MTVFASRPGVPVAGAKVMTRNRKITHVIYDMDGVLLDTESFYTKAATIFAARYGKEFGPGLKSRMIGKKSIDSARIFVESLGLPLAPEEYLKAREDLLNHLLPQAQQMPGAERLTLHLKQAKVPQAVATSSDTYHFRLKTTLHKSWFGIFDCLILGDDPALKRGKPAPDIFLLAAERLGATPSVCLVFEDAPAGVEAAQAAGMSVVAVPDRLVDPACYGCADQILPSLVEFVPEEWGLPAYQYQIGI
jgi:HAD superfamily hydrolase (TIGR01509 family)